jgi:hypothetical protein
MLRPQGITVAAKTRALADQIVAAGAVRLFKRADIDGDGTLTKVRYRRASHLKPRVSVRLSKLCHPSFLYTHREKVLPVPL